MEVPLAVIYLGDFFPPVLVAAGLAVGLVARRWIVLTVPLTLWIAAGVLGLVLSIRTGRGDPVIMFGLAGLYFAPLGLTLAVGVVLGRFIRRPGQDPLHRHHHASR